MKLIDDFGWAFLIAGIAVNNSIYVGMSFLLWVISLLASFIQHKSK